MKKKTALVVGIAVVLGIAALASGAGPFARVPQRDFEERYLSMDRSPVGLQQYRREMRQWHRIVEQKGIPAVHSTVTLAKPLAIEDAVDLIESFDLQPRLIYAFALDSDGALITVGGKFSRGLEVQLPEIVREENATLVGVVSVIGSVPTEVLGELQGDSRVFLVDVSADGSLVRNPRNEEYMQHFAWDLYEQAENAGAEEH